MTHSDGHQGESVRIVVGPKRLYTEVVCEYGGPTYDVHDVYLVIGASTRKEARWAAFRRARENGDQWYTDLDREHPLKGVDVHEAEQGEVEHGGWEPRQTVLIGSRAEST